MPELSDFRLGAAVETSDGRKVGTLVSVLVEEQGFEPKALVVKHDESLVGRLMAAEKLFITDEIVVPIGAVESATRDLVRLSMAAPALPAVRAQLSQHSLPACTRRAQRALDAGDAAEARASVRADSARS